MRSRIAVALIFCLVWVSIPWAAGPTSRVLSSSTTTSDDGATESDFVVQRTMPNGDVLVITAHTSRKDNGSSYHWTVLGTVDITQHSTGKAGTLPLAATLHGLRGSFNSNGTQNHVVHAVRQVHGRQIVSDQVYAVNPSQDGTSVGLALDQKLALYDQMPCGCSAQQSWLSQAWARVWSWFETSVHAQTGDPWIDCYAIAESTCYLVGVLLGPEVWLACMTATYAACLGSYGNLWP